ncbi:MAG: tRNA 2-thiouridine(34) synthase MnmA [Planctomycetes bacterium]|nr:tRNA 2-thiouridine(34) synthase MnmA [Planctomycetota bacterium]
MSSERVLVALSGGVDSSVAALLLAQQGYEVVGCFLRNGISRPAGSCSTKQGCCSAEDARDAALVADQLGIPYHAVDMHEEFASVQNYFHDEYAAGRTPNPCAVCNRDIKFGALADFADAIGAQWIATGHYAQIRQGEQGPELLRGADAHKDQSYVLFPVAPSILARTLLPVGGLQKSETRRIAEEAGLPVFGKPDSQEICFVPSGDYRDVLRKRGGLGKPGRIVDLDGKERARHEGYMGFTRGQRRGLGFAATEPMYVVDIRPDTGDVIVGPRAATGCAVATVAEFRGFGCSLAEGEVWDEVTVQYRSSPGGVPARVEGLGKQRVRIEFARPAESVTPGQGLAVYRGDRLLGGGWLHEATPAVEMRV